MKNFLDEDFLLQNEPARVLYHDYAKEMPIFDYHNHLSPRQIAEDIKFDNIGRVWLDRDHYKWRLMRALGIDEKYITGDSTDREKYDAWARVFPYTIGNCVYTWTHMELKRFFGINGKLFGPDTADEIWKIAGEHFKKDEMSICNIIRGMKVKVLCTTDDPVDPLDQHEIIRKRHHGFIVVPTFRPDKALDVENPVAWNAYLANLEAAAGMTIRSFEEFVGALEKRHAFFHNAGARATDHAIVYPFAEESTKDERENIFAKLRRNESLSEKEVLQFKTAALYEVGRMNHRRGWVMQLHMSALRNTNTRKFKVHGPDSGFNSMADYAVAAPLARFLDLLDRNDELPKTVLFTLNQNQNDVLAAMAGNFNDGRIRGKMQFGAAWWFNDQKDGIEKHLVSIANMGNMATFIGMLTDAAGVFAFVRHEYFRRIVCNVIGTWIEHGELPRDYPHIGGIVRDISYNNAMNYFGVEGIA